jgi:hypothetical protein
VKLKVPVLNWTSVILTIPEAPDVIDFIALFLSTMPMDKEQSVNSALDIRFDLLPSPRKLPGRAKIRRRLILSMHSSMLRQASIVPFLGKHGEDTDPCPNAGHQASLVVNAVRGPSAANILGMARHYDPAGDHSAFAKIWDLLRVRVRRQDEPNDTWLCFGIGYKSPHASNEIEV